VLNFYFSKKSEKQILNFSKYNIQISCAFKNYRLQLFDSPVEALLFVAKLCENSRGLVTILLVDLIKQEKITF